MTSLGITAARDAAPDPKAPAALRPRRSVKYARMPLAVSLEPQRQPHSTHRPLGVRAWLSGPPSSLPVAGGRRPLRAYCEVRAHIAPGKLSAATPTAFHPRSRWVNPPSASLARPGGRKEAGKYGHTAKGARICGLGCPRLVFELLPRRSTRSEAPFAKIEQSGARKGDRDTQRLAAWFRVAGASSSASVSFLATRSYPPCSAAGPHPSTRPFRDRRLPL
jgi:hypothetical protein